MDNTYIQDGIRDKIKEAVNKNLIKLKAYTKARRKSVAKKGRPNDQVMSRQAFQLMFLKSAVVRSFPIYCLTLSLPIFRNKFYLSTMATLDKDYDNRQKDLKTLALMDDSSKEYKTLSENSKLAWTERKAITLIMIPRSTMKSTIFQSARAGFLYLRDTVIHNQSPVVSFTHADISKAEKNLVLCMKYLKTDIMQTMFANELVLLEDNKSQVRFEDKSDVKRSEPHFMTDSVNSDFTGDHATYYLIDDWVSEENVSS